MSLTVDQEQTPLGQHKGLYIHWVHWDPKRFPGRRGGLRPGSGLLRSGKLTPTPSCLLNGTEGANVSPALSPQERIRLNPRRRALVPGAPGDDGRWLRPSLFSPGWGLAWLAVARASGGERP